MNIYLALSVGVAALTSLLLGYDIGIMSVALIYIRKDVPMDKVGEGVLVGFSLLTSYFSHKISSRGVVPPSCSLGTPS